jgi:hypothetical protein
MPCFCRADWSDKHKVFVITKVFCHLGCWNYWTLKVEPFWLRLLEDWSETLAEREIRTRKESLIERNQMLFEEQELRKDRRPYLS